jgi:hypothetical protein
MWDALEHYRDESGANVFVEEPARIRLPHGLREGLDERAEALSAVAP